MRGLVVKVGGSLAGSDRLNRVLACLVNARRPVVVVPGGGTYADAVRARQKREGLSDLEAHWLAIAAMHKLAADMIHMQPGLVPAETVGEIRSAWRRGLVPVWLPLRLARRDATIPADWSITSDGLAARLAECLGRLPLLVVKSCRVLHSARAGALARQGIVDPVFADIVGRSGLRWHIVGPGDEAALRSRLGRRRAMPRTLR